MLEKLKQKHSYYVFCFFIVSISSWFLEILYSLIMRFRLVNPGVLTGTWVPIYGIGFIFLVLLIKKETNRIYNFIKIMLIATIVELIASYMLSELFDTVIWDYSRYPFNFDGRIALHTSIMFGIVGYLFIYKLEPLLNKLYDKVGNKGKIIAYVLLVLFILDIVLTLIF